MILTRLKDHLVVNGRTNRTELAKIFGISEDGIDAMLTLWVAKGQNINNSQRTSSTWTIKLRCLLSLE
ncbi:FeoC-like transcriptional regulator [Moritella viscosa]